MRRVRCSLLAMALILGACGRPITFDGSDQTFSAFELKYRLMDKLGTLFYCDPDYYPIARGDEAQLAVQRFPGIQQDTSRFNAILGHLGWLSRTDFSDDDKLRIYRESKKLNAVMLDPVNDSYSFRISVNEHDGKLTVMSGDVDTHGRIVVDKQEAGFATCPICLPGNTPIATPAGDVKVRNVKVGMVVWSVDAAGERVAVTVLKTRRVPVPAGHVLVRIRLSDEREVTASPAHPTTDGRTFGELKVGDALDGALVVAVQSYGSAEPATYDLLPAGPTGAYWANGVLIGSTLFAPRTSAALAR